MFFDEWWEKVHMTTSAFTRRGLNSLIILGAWILWNHRNWCVFDGAAPHMVESLNPFRKWKKNVDDGWSVRVEPFDAPPPLSGS
jgi:hypothetical protein